MALLALALVPARAAAAPTSALAVAKPGGGQLGLAVGFLPEGQLRASVCSAEPCSLERAVPIAVPDSAAKQASTAKLRIVRLGTDRKAVIVEIPEPAAARTWTAVLAGPLSGTAPVVAFSGYTGFTEGPEDERSGPSVYVGTQREGYDLCGRPAILAPQVLDPKTLTLKAAKVQRLDDAERAAAPLLTARAAEGPPAPPLLHALWATSAAPGAPASALTDGKIETAWAEGRGGAGRGELAVLSASRAVAIGAFELAIPPRRAPHAAVPRDVWLVTERQVFHVALPEAPAAEGGRFEVALPSPVATACVALVLEGATAEDAEASVAVAELGAKPAAGASTDELLRALAGGGPEAEAAGAVLRVSGGEALSKVAAAFSGLDEGGRRVALDVLDDAPCPVALPVYISALIGPIEAQRLHAKRAMDRCSKDAAPAFEDAIKNGSPKERVLLADELSSVAPATAVTVLVPLFAKATVAERRAYRNAIGRAALAGAAQSSVVAALDGASTPPATLIDLLRALGTNVAAFGDPARRAFGRVLTPKATFRTRYLLLGPAAELAKIDGSARAFVERSLKTEADPRVRTEAARILREPSPYRVHLSRLLDDPAVRVREAAVVALGAARAMDALDRVLYVMEHDSWPLVRVAAAHAVAELPAGRTIDDALGRSVEDPSYDVRRAALRAIGIRRATTDVQIVRDRFEDAEELPGVRAEAAQSLGMLCDAKSADVLTEHARKLASPTLDESERMIGKGALVGLSLIHPADLEKRLAPLLVKDAPTPVKLFAATALRSQGRCPAGKPGPVPAK
jgi:HEAT repeat protein